MNRNRRLQRTNAVIQAEVKKLSLPHNVEWGEKAKSTRGGGDRHTLHFRRNCAHRKGRLTGLHLDTSIGSGVLKVK